MGTKKGTATGYLTVCLRRLLHVLWLSLENTHGGMGIIEGFLTVLMTKILYIWGMEYIVNIITEQLQQNEFFQGTALVALLMSALYQLKALPMTIWIRVKRVIVYQVTVEESDPLYVLVSDWISTKYPHKLRKVEAILQDKKHYNVIHGQKDRYDEASGVRICDDGRPSLRLVHLSDVILIRRGRHFLLVSKERDRLENAQSFERRYMGTITISSLFTRKPVINLLEEVRMLIPKQEDKVNNTNKYTISTGNYFENRGKVRGKKMDALFFKGKEELLDRIKKFCSEEEWYEERGINYCYGILLYGAPGQGKTSFAMALSKMLGRDLYLFNMASMSDDAFKECSREVPQGSIVLMDDVDVGIADRNKNKSSASVTLSSILGFLDGADTPHNCIIVLNTNHIESLDHALVRKGRIDYMLEMKSPDKEQAEKFLSHFYGNEIKLHKFVSNMSVAELQDLCMNNPQKETIKICEGQGDQ